MRNNGLMMTAGNRSRRNGWASLLAIVTVVMLAVAVLPPPAFAAEVPDEGDEQIVDGEDDSPDLEGEEAEPDGDDADAGDDGTEPDGDGTEPDEGDGIEPDGTEPDGDDDAEPRDDDTDADEDSTDAVVAYGRVAGVVWVDGDGDGTRRSDEDGFGGVELTLIGGDGTEITSTGSDASGGYGFEDVEPGVYLVRAAASDEAVVESDPFEIVGDDEVTVDLGLTPVESTEVPEADDEESSEGDEGDDPADGSDGAAPIDEGDDEIPAIEVLAGPPVYEITGAWVNQPATIASGNPVVAEWRVNVNDSAEPPSNDPVDNVTVDFNVDKAFFDGIPDVCLTVDVDPPSSISPDGMMLTCNLGTVNMGTAVVVQTPVVANGITGEEVTHDGTIDGQTIDLPPIPIANIFVMDFHYGQNTNIQQWNDDLTEVLVDVQWSLRLGKGSDPGPDEVSYQLTVVPTDGSLIVGENPNSGVVGCSPFDLGNAEGHPWSPPETAPNAPERTTNFVDSCTLVQTGANTFQLTLSGIDYSLVNAPTHDSGFTGGTGGNLLPPDFNYIASGSLWFRVDTNQAGSTSLQSNAPTYTAPTGQTYPDPPGNNATNKSYTLPGSFAANYCRGCTFSGGTSWDDTYRVSAGSLVRPSINNRFFADNADPDSRYGQCNVLDTRFVTLADADPNGNSAVPVHAWDPVNRWRLAAFPLTITLEYYVGNNALVDPTSPQYNPDQFDCGVDPGGWVTAQPADLSTVKAVRSTHPYQQFADEGAESIHLSTWTKIDDDVPVGQDIWTFGSALRNGTWIGPAVGNPVTPTPDARYPFTTGRRDIVRIISAVPFLEKSAAQATVTAGVPADFTLTYSANGAGSIPPTVDGYEIVDTLPVGMTYQEGSADPEPVVTMNGGQQVLTWTLDGVATNVEHTLTYQATADTSVEPGTALTNVAVSSYGGESSSPVEETVTTTSNGFTTILKTSDVDYIPNDAGDGVGTGSWTVAIDSFDPLPQAFTDTIDILPYVGDQRGTSFSGTYSLDDVVLLNGGTVYYTDADPAFLSDDPADVSNGSAGDPAGNTVGWTTDMPDNPTAIRVIGGELPAGGSFGFQVVITTDGAQPQDVYVNRAQARAEHTELVMRTSAALVVTDYVVVKTSDPVSGSTVFPGDTVNYTITVTQQGPVPAGALFTDDWSDVLDDAVYNDDLATDLGNVSLTDGVVSWDGVIPVGGVATITYSMTLKDIAGLEAEGNTLLHNVVESPGCVSVEDCETVIFTGWYEFSKTSVAIPGAIVQVDEVITYTVEITQRGEGPIEGAWIEDDLSAVLDDAIWNDALSVSAGAASLTGSTLRWDGDLAVGDVVTLTYSVTVTKGGDSELANKVTTDHELGICVPAPDENPDCETNHILGDYEVVKVSDPVSGSPVEIGDVVNYTVTVSHVGIATVDDAYFDDDVTEVLDDATWNGDVSATAGATSYSAPTLSWSGVLNPGDVVTVTYSVTVTGDGDRHLVNVVTTGGQCVPAEGQDEACTTEHFNGAFVFAKTSDPAPGTIVAAGDVVTYTVTIEPVGAAPVEGASIEDDLSGVLDDASWNNDAQASSGDVSYANPTLAWNGDLGIGEAVTLTYSVTVTHSDANLVNVVSTTDERGLCTAAADGNADCITEHPPVAPGQTKGPLPFTGADLMRLAAAGLVLLLGGGILLKIGRRRRGATATV